MFITVSRGLNGSYYIVLADDSGPIERLENWDYDNLDKAESEAEKLAKADNVKFL